MKLGGRIKVEKKTMQIVTAYGTMWARNTENIQHIPKSRDGGQGVYILFDGSMPVYAGKGNIRTRITKHRRSKRTGQLWDRFSWYAIKEPKMMHDIEVLILRILPPYLRALTRQDGKFIKPKKGLPPADKKTIDYITRKP
jgi:hypothetical protein